MVILAAAGAVLVYAIRSLLGGLSAAAFAILSPLAQVRMVRAVSETPLTFFMLLGVLGARRGRDGSLPLGWAVGLGVVLGLARPDANPDKLRSRPATPMAISGYLP
jgi:4-amino-4-deoxy-L-arabinose transferase-like glycosyltransferase